MKLSVKLPNVSLSGGQLPEELTAGGRRQQLFRQARRFIGWGILGAVFFVIFGWLSIPTRAIAWRISHEAYKAGVKLDVEDISIRPWGSATLYNVVWTFDPTRPEIPPAQYVLETVDVRVKVLSLLAGTLDVEVETPRPEGRIWANYRKESETSTVAVKIEDLPLFDVPRAAAALGVPLLGIVALDAELTLPEHKFGKAEGTIALSCSGCRAGDGISKLYIPGGKTLAQEGLTIPEVDLGTLTGRFVVEEGKAVLDPALQTESEDLSVEVAGRLLLRDPVARSQFNMTVKVRLTEAFQERSDAVRFMYQGAGPKSKLDPPEEGLGFLLEGTVGRPRFRGIKSQARGAAAAARPGGRGASARRPSPVGRPGVPNTPNARGPLVPNARPLPGQNPMLPSGPPAGEPAAVEPPVPEPEQPPPPTLEELNAVDAIPEPGAVEGGLPPQELPSQELPPQEIPAELPVEPPVEEVLPQELPPQELPAEGVDGIVIQDGGEFVE